MNKGATLALAALGAAGLGFTLLETERGVETMEGQHWVMLAIMLVVGYVAGRLWTQPAQLLGLP